MKKTVSLPEALIRLENDGMPIPRYTLQRWLDTGAIPCCKSGNRYYIYYQNIVNFLQGGQQRPTQSTNPEPESVPGIRKVDIK